MGCEKLGHGEAPHSLCAKDLGHLLVGSEELLVLRILEIVLLEVGPQLLHALGPGCLLLANDIGKVSGQFHGLGQT